MRTEINDLLKNTARTLYLSVRAMPANLQQSFALGYLFCRTCDSIADKEIIPKNARLNLIDIFPFSFADASTRKQIIGEINSVSKKDAVSAERELLKMLPALFEEFDKLPSAAKGNISEVVSKVCIGMRKDLEFFDGDIKAFPAGGDLIDYCRNIGGAPGVFWMKELARAGAVRAGAENSGEQTGIALQLVNILKDIRDDIKIGRCYLPSEDLSKNGINAQDLARPSEETAIKIKPVIYKWIKYALGSMDGGVCGITSISKRNLGLRAAAILPVYWGLDTLSLLAKNAGEILLSDKKVKITRRKIYATVIFSVFPSLFNGIFLAGYRRRRGNILAGFEERL